MLLYHAVTNWQIMACVLHKLRFFPKESAELLVPSFVQRKIPKLHIRTQTFFSDVGTYETTETKTWNAGHRFGGYRLEDFDGIYVAGAQFPFSYFCIWRNMPFSFLEEAAGRFLRPGGLEQSVYASNPQMYTDGKKLGLFDASHSLIDKVYADVPKDGWRGDARVVRFDVSEEIAKLPAVTVNALRKLFSDGEDIQLQGTAGASDGHALLLITQHFANLKMMTMEEQKRLYLNTVDYYLGEDEALFVKPHPDDLLYYEELFPDAVVYPANLLIELLTELKTFQHARILAVNSTAVHAFPKADVLSFSSSYLKSFQDLPMYAAVRAIYENACEQKHLLLCLIGSDSNIFRNWGIATKDAKHGMVFLCGEPADVHDLEKFSVIVSSFFNDAMQELVRTQNRRLIAKRIIVSRQEDVLYDKNLFILMADDDLHEAIASLEVAYDLKYSKEHFQMENLIEKDIEIAALKGIIESLERRVDSLLKENDALREQTKTERELR